MALVKPIVNEIIAFDSRDGATITFTANGGDQVVKNQIKVVTNDANETIVYNPAPVTTYAFQNTIPANVLVNGRYYKVAIRTYDVLNNTSAWSNYQPFYCYTTPSLSLNIADGQTISSATCSIQLTYTQPQNEKVDYALIEVYNHNNILIDSSDNLYNADFPPLTFRHDVVGLIDNSQYYIVATVVTINGTIVKTNNIRFYTNFEPVINPATLTATLDSCNGYVNLHSSILGKIGGISNPTPLTYINHNTEADLRNAVADFDIENSYWAKWNKLFAVPTDFLLRLWFYPARQPFKIISLTNGDQSSYMTINFRRGTTYDYLSIRTDNGTTIDKSLGMHCNGNTKVFLWVKVVENTWDVQFSILNTTATVMEWNSNNNTLPYNVTSDFTYENETFETFTPSSDNYEEISGEFTSVILGNGVFDHMNITKNTSITYSTAIPTWDEDTILDINFNGNINNTSPNYTKLVLKRKDDTLLSWLNLSEIDVDYNVPTYIDFNDSFIPTGVKQEYALVVYIDDIPSEYHTVDITPIWGKYFLSDKNNRFVLNAAVIYSNHAQNIQNGVLMPIGAKYPIVIQNGEGNYRSGSLQFKVLGYQFEEDKRLDRVSMTKQLNDILTFLTNGGAKCLTDFNGNIFIIKVVNTPQISYDANWGNNIPTVSFDWVEQGKYNNYDDMLGLGLFDYVAAE